jgi:transcriptional regulator with GAF, ATPase, and Fis domain
MRFAARLGKPFDGIAPDTLNSLQRYSWPGNIRELENIVERAVILSEGRALEVSPEMLPAVAIDTSNQVKDLVSTDLESIEREHIVAVLSQSRWVIEGARGAAQALGLHPNTLRSRMKKLGISRPTHDHS